MLPDVFYVYLRLHKFCVLGNIWFWCQQNTYDGFMCVFVCVCVCVSSVKHNAWPAAGQILAETLDPDRTHTGSENNSMNTHQHQHKHSTHMRTQNTQVWEEKTFTDNSCLSPSISCSYDLLMMVTFSTCTGRLQRSTFVLNLDN